MSIVGEAVVIGDRRKYLTAVISLDVDEVPAFAKEHGLDKDTLHESPKLQGMVQLHVDKVNKDLARVEQVKKFAILARSFSIEEGELTPTLKVKRKKVYEHFADEIEALYAE